MDCAGDFHLRVATSEDFSHIIHLLKQVAQWMKDKGINQWRFLLDGGDDEEIKQAIIDGQTYIVLKGSEIAATFTLLSNQSDWDRHIWGEDASSKSLYLHRLAINPAYMKKGLGAGILDWIQSTATNVEYLKLDCVADNDKLNNFYKNNDFELVGITDGHCKYQKLF